MRGRSSGRWGCAVALAVAVAVSGCGDLADGPSAGAYAGAVSWAVPAAAEGPRPVVYVATIGDSIALEDQVSVIDTLEDTHDVRFIDDFAEVLDVDALGHPPIDDAVLVALDHIDADLVPVVVRVEVYRSDTRLEAFLVTLEGSAGSWRVVGSDGVAPEALVVAP